MIIVWNPGQIWTSISYMFWSPMHIWTIRCFELDIICLYTLTKSIAPINGAEWFDVGAKICHMRPIQRRKLKLFKVLIYGGGSAHPYPRWKNKNSNHGCAFAPFFFLWSPNQVFYENPFFLKIMYVQKSGKCSFGRKKAPAGWFHSKTKVVTTSRHTPDPTRTKLYPKINNLVILMYFQ